MIFCKILIVSKITVMIHPNDSFITVMQWERVLYKDKPENYSQNIWKMLLVSNLTAGFEKSYFGRYI